LLITFLNTSCNISIYNPACRDVFDEEKEPDGMVLSGWSGPTTKPEKSSTSSNGESSSAAVGKRKLEELSDGNGKHKGIAQQIEVNDDDDDVSVLDGFPDVNKKKRVQ
jgi:ubiquitin-like 1-activating enzyme E1 B